MTDANAIYKRVINKLQKDFPNLSNNFTSKDHTLILSASIIAEALSNSINNELFDEKVFEQQGGKK